MGERAAAADTKIGVQAAFSPVTLHSCTDTKIGVLCCSSMRSEIESIAIEERTWLRSMIGCCAKCGPLHFVGAPKGEIVWGECKIYGGVQIAHFAGNFAVCVSVGGWWTHGGLFFIHL